jgi:hypothetical protein
MKHLKDARQFILEGDAQGALEIIENILSFSPKNPEALLLKSNIYDAWGRFDDSLLLLHHLTKISSDERAGEELRTRMEEDRESLIYSKLTPEGRIYFPFSPIQVFISLFGLMGCLLFLLSSPGYSHEANGGGMLLLSFLSLVFFPWMLLIILSLKGIKRIQVGLHGIQVFYGWTSKSFQWSQFSCAVIEYDKDLNEDYLKLILYSSATREPLLCFDISRRYSIVKARRHFVRLILTYLDVVSYVPRGRATEQDNESSEVNHKIDVA